MAMTTLREPQRPGSIKSTITQKSKLSIALAVVSLVFTGTIAGVIASFSVLAVSAVAAQLGNPTAQTFSQLVINMFSRFMNVLTVWARAPIDGATMGLAAGLAVSVAYLAVIWVDRRISSVALQRWVVLALLALAGAMGAGLGSQGVLADRTLWTSMGGAFFGLVAAFAVTEPELSV